MSRSVRMLAAASCAGVIASVSVPMDAAAQQRRFSCATYAGKDLGLITIMVLGPNRISALGLGGRKTLNRTGRGQTYSGAGYQVIFTPDQKAIDLAFPGGKANCWYAR